MKSLYKMLRNLNEEVYDKNRMKNLYVYLNFQRTDSTHYYYCFGQYVTVSVQPSKTTFNAKWYLHYCFTSHVVCYCLCVPNTQNFTLSTSREHRSTFLTVCVQQSKTTFNEKWYLHYSFTSPLVCYCLCVANTQNFTLSTSREHRCRCCSERCCIREVVGVNV